MFPTCILPVLLFVYHGHALPAPNATALPWDTGMLAAIDSTNPRAQPTRTLFSVAWGCILTAFICGWSSVHPNMPPPRSRMGGLLARVTLMFWTIVAPELVLAWAVRQWFSAREVRDIYNQHTGNRRRRRWTIAHGQFLVMGGFTLVSDKIHRLEEPEQPGWLSTAADWDSYSEYTRQRERCQLGLLTFERLKEIVDDPNVVFPAITAAQIRSQSKGDGLSKLVTILQTSWFILQCAARGFQGLALTELELVTLAMASLNAIMFAFWWDKPLGAEEPVHVYATVPAQGNGNARVMSNREDDSVISARDILHAARIELTFIFNPPRHRLVQLPISLFYLLTFPVFVLFPFGIVFLLWIIKSKKVAEQTVVATTVTLRLHYNLTHSIRQYFGGVDGPLRTVEDISGWFFIVPASFFLLLLLLLLLIPLFVISIVSLTLNAAFKIVTTNTVRPRATHVPVFYAPRTKSDRYSRMIVFFVFGAIFGGIHCIAWNFTFPTHSERSLWRYTSLVLTAIPLLVGPIDFILENIPVGKKLELTLAIVMTALLSLYVPARLSLIAQALALLRNQPADAYVAVDWTKYIPHLFS